VLSIHTSIHLFIYSSTYLYCCAGCYRVVARDRRRSSSSSSSSSSFFATLRLNARTSTPNQIDTCLPDETSYTNASYTEVGLDCLSFSRALLLLSVVVVVVVVVVVAAFGFLFVC